MIMMVMMMQLILSVIIYTIDNRVGDEKDNENVRINSQYIRDWDK
jgi:hypothetical protein